MGQASWLVAGIVPGIERQPLKKLPTDQEGFCSSCVAGGRKQPRLDAPSSASPLHLRPVAMASGWHAGCVRSEIEVMSFIRRASRPREHRRAKTDRLDTELLKRAFLGWLRGEPNHCTMAAIPTIEDEDARAPEP